MVARLDAKKKAEWLQTPREAHESWARLVVQSPRAAQLMHVLVARLGDHNAVVASHRVLAAMMGVRSVNTVKSAIATLREQRWLEVRQIGGTGTVCAYVVNDRVAWFGPRDGRRYSMFSASVLVASDEQEDAAELDRLPPIRSLPRLFGGETQVPSGPGLPPPSQPSFDGFEHPLPLPQGRGVVRQPEPERGAEDAMPVKPRKRARKPRTTG